MDVTRPPAGDIDATVATPSGTGFSTSRTGNPSPNPSPSARFEPGTLFAGRFRIVALLGRGGMGEVYRADDLRLEQPVALKLLPDTLAHDPARLAQFHNEVRVARTVAHRNVCRMYDIGDADGRVFMAMEYVDGEDLSSLLRRIGRFPQDKAIEVARQICAGLAAAHERGVIHRDLKPANVMIDGEGHVRLTDFGLASLGGAVDNVRSGTPAYMAPEQLSGKEVTQRSDIFALGLVLYELFTGKRVFEAKTLNELISLHESTSRTSPSSVVRDLDPQVERAIMRCLEHEPAKRPTSALAVSAALPGGDQLAAALAAGETPSPEMVAAAGEQSALRPSVGLALLAFTILMVGVLSVLFDRYAVVHRIPLPRSTDSLKDRAQELLEKIGYVEPPADSTYGWSVFNRLYLLYDGREQKPDDPWPALESGRTGTAQFWYRTSPAALVSSFGQVAASESDPPLLLSDMRIVRLDAHGRLLELQSIPAQYDASDARAATPIDWTVLFDAAALPMAQFHEVTPQWRPRGDADERHAWEGPLPDVPNTTVRVEAAAVGNRPIFFSVVYPWSVPQRMVSSRPQETLAARIVTVLAGLLGMALVIAAAFLARRNLRSGHGDRRGAFRTAAILFVAESVGYFLRARHSANIDAEYVRLYGIVAVTFVRAIIAWTTYIALEPYVRRFWPQLLIGWTRLMSGRVRDPLVGRDFLVGAACGTIAALLIGLLNLVPALLHHAYTPGLPLPLVLQGDRYAVALALGQIVPAFNNAIQCLAVAVFLRILVKRTWLVFALSMLLILPVAMNNQFTGDNAALQMPIFLTGVAMMFAILMRFGLLTLVIAFLTMHLTEIFPMTLNLDRPYAHTSVLLMIGIVGLAAYGYYASRGDEPLFGGDLLEQHA